MSARLRVSLRPQIPPRHVLGPGTPERTARRKIPSHRIGPTEHEPGPGPQTKAQRTTNQKTISWPQQPNLGAVAASRLALSELAFRGGEFVLGEQACSFNVASRWISSAMPDDPPPGAGAPGTLSAGRETAQVGSADPRRPKSGPAAPVGRSSTETSINLRTPDPQTRRPQTRTWVLGFIVGTSGG